MSDQCSDNVGMSVQYAFMCFHSYPYLPYLIPTLFLYFFRHPYITVHFVKCFYYLYIYIIIYASSFGQYKQLQLSALNVFFRSLLLQC